MAGSKICTDATPRTSTLPVKIDGSLCPESKVQSKHNQFKDVLAADDEEERQTSTPDMPFKDLLDQAVKIKSAQQATMRREFDKWPKYLQHSLYMARDLDAVRDLDYGPRCAAALAKKEAGNAAFKQSQFQEACNIYEQALAIFTYVVNTDNNWKTKGIQDESLTVINVMEDVSSSGVVVSLNQPTEGELEMDAFSKQEMASFKLAVYSNMAACLLKLQDFTECRKACNDALKIDPTNAKALYRRALARITPPSSGATDVEIAIGDLKAAVKSDPEDHVIRTLLAKLQAETIAQRASDKQFSGMFSRGNIIDPEEEETLLRANVPLTTQADFEKNVHEAETAVRILDHRGEHKEAAELRTKIVEAKKAAATRAAQAPDTMDFENPTAEMIADALKQGIDLSDLKVRAMLVELQQEKLKGLNENTRSSAGATKVPTVPLQGPVSTSTVKPAAAQLIEVFSKPQLHRLLKAQGDAMDDSSNVLELRERLEPLLLHSLAKHMDVDLAKTVCKYADISPGQFKTTSEMMAIAQYYITSKIGNNKSITGAKDPSHVRFGKIFLKLMVGFFSFYFARRAVHTMRQLSEPSYGIYGMDDTALALSKGYIVPFEEASSAPIPQDNDADGMEHEEL